MKAYLNMIIAGEKILKKYKRYLKKGHYGCQAGSKLIYYHCGDIDEKKLETFIDNSFSKQKKVLSLITKTLLISSGIGTASIAMLTVNGDVKIFDYEKEIIITNFKDIKKAQKIKRCITSYAAFFMIPSISTSAKENQIIEKIIRQNTAIPDRKCYAFRQFAEQYISYLSSIKKEKKVVVKWEKLLGNGSDDVKKIILHIDQELKKCLIEVPIHGDGHIDNLIIDEDKNVYVVDWETERIDWFLYDFLNYCYVDYLNYYSYEMLDYYFDGKLDDIFERVFKAMGLKYDSRQKADYLKIYFIFRIRFENNYGHFSAKYREALEHYNIL